MEIRTNFFKNSLNYLFWNFWKELTESKVKSWAAPSTDVTELPAGEVGEVHSAEYEHAYQVNKKFQNIYEVKKILVDILHFLTLWSNYFGHKKV